MTREEHMDILAFFDRVMNSADAAVDVEADAIIRAMFKRNPDAAYHVTKLAMTLAAQPALLSVQASPPASAPKQAGKPRQWFASLLHRNPHAVF
ncbi:DUF2076 domain-containing protein [Acidocella aromatica]|uniref:Uncharacterized protein n=1 Tax=Acidocella aromatica TaxID=1303579 RepID=A0A840VP21_9PROT|nr:hypothetical protein [Acidocella aromatica]MBB5372062.1 hypothetical protein [Acidocella aromatica]